MKVAGRFVKSVKELRDYLDEVESQWTDKDEEFLGDFEQQSLWIPYFDELGNFEGYGEPAIDSPAFAGGTLVLDRHKNYKGFETSE